MQLELAARVRRAGGQMQLWSLSLGNEGTLKGPMRIAGPTNGLHLGQNVHIGENFFVDTHGGVSIGDHCHVSREVIVLSSMHDPVSNLLPFDSSRLCKPVAIGSACWIGMGVTILPGVTIGDDSIVGAGATVTKDVPPLSVVVGTDRVLYERERSHVHSLRSQGRFSGENGMEIGGRSD